MSSHNNPTQTGDYFEERGRFQPLLSYFLSHPDKKQTRALRYMWTVYKDAFENGFVCMLTEQMQRKAAYLVEWSEKHQNEIPPICDDFISWLSQVADEDPEDEDDQMDEDSDDCLDEGYTMFIEDKNPSMEAFLEIILLHTVGFLSWA